MCEDQVYIFIGHTEGTEPFRALLCKYEDIFIYHFSWDEALAQWDLHEEKWKEKANLNVYFFMENLVGNHVVIKEICLRCLKFKSFMLYEEVHRILTCYMFNPFLWENREFLTPQLGKLFYGFYFTRLNKGSLFLKRSFDMIFSALGLVLMSPLFLLCALLIKLDSRGPVFYNQIRIGKMGKEFRIHKFRSMKVDAEQGTPELSSENDPRVTPWGRIMRRYRIDELPQLWNVLKGDMSIVGYRPEREYFIKQIEEYFPFYPLLYNIRPGITSQGMVNYGYAKDLNEMLARLGEDMLYLDRIRYRLIRQDLQVLFKTIKVVLRGLGR